MRRLPRLLVAVTAAAAGLPIVAAAPAGADPVGDARSRAAALARQVDALETRAEVATERYDAVQERLGAAVTARMLAQRALEAAQSGVAADQTVSEDRVRALYESGGPTTLLATVLDGSNPADALARYHDVSVVLGADKAHEADGRAFVDRAAALSARLDASAAEVTRLQAAAATAAREVRSLLATRRQALSAADAEVRRLVREARAAAAAAAARNFADALAAAGGSMSPDMAPPNEVVATMLTAAKSKLGDPYLWGGTGPDAFDCSGLTQFAYRAAGITLPRVAADQWNVGAHVDLADLQPGDLLFWATDVSAPRTIHHVAIYLGNGMMLAAPHTGDVVKVQPVYMDGYIGATRPYASA